MSLPLLTVRDNRLLRVMFATGRLVVDTATVTLCD